VGPSRKASLEDQHDRKERQEHSRGPRRSRREHERRSEEGVNNEDQPRPQNQLIVREIHTISGGLAGGGESTSARKAHARSIHIEEVYQVGRPCKVQKRDIETISFSNEDANGVSMPHDDALVVTMIVANHAIHQILVDNGNSAEIIYWSVIQQMGISRDRIKPFGSPLVGFTGEQVQTMGVISLPITYGTSPRDSTIMVDFLVIDQPFAYNAIIGCPALNKLRAITSTYHLMMKFPTKNGIGELKGNQAVVRRCYNISLKRVINSEFLPVSVVSSTNEAEIKGKPAETLEEIVVGNGKILKIGSQLDPDIQEGIIDFLRKNIDSFAWTHEDMPGIDPENIIHCLNTSPEASPVKQKRRKFAPERNLAIAEEVEKLLKARFIQEVYYPDWLANVVLVKKSNGKWRMCIDFTDLNKAYPKDSFPLPQIDMLVNSTAGHRLLSFMDTFSGYNQIRMHPADQEKTAFITDQGIYCYQVMPFGLKNAGATFQRLMNKMFREQIGRNMEVYLDDILVKSVLSIDHVGDL
jgi:hypothetical protein